MPTIENLETQIEYIVNRYKDIDKEKEDKRKQNKKSIENLSTYAPVIILLMLISFLIGSINGAYLFH